MRYYIALWGILICIMLYGDQRLNIKETGKRNRFITVLVWLIGAATVAAMIVSG